MIPSRLLPHQPTGLQKVQHTQVERERDYLFLMLHFPVSSHSMDHVTIGQVGIFLGRNFLITIRTAESAAITDLFGVCRQSQEKGEGYFRQGPAYMLYLLVGKLLDDISIMTDRVVAELDDLEDIVFGNSRSDAQRIGKVRQKIVRLRRITGPKRLILQDLAEQINSFTGHDMSKYYDNNTKTVNKLWEEIQEAKETVEIFKDADFTTSTEHTNQILAVLTIIFTLTIPITVVGTLYGMNVPLPGGIQTGPWSFLGTYTTFAVMVALSALIALGMYVYFRRKKWF
jgi:magnesium transporter